ncbi:MULTISPECIES: ArpU family phage packaging/lysis transcriptional regulator [Lacticaseibacillus]|uniref:ArpU family phage packaging/lysis transcriptional regulator n=2 Tax=Lacticaseibacillus TaxID=2759736 RepID=A0ABW4CIA1_9LACO|nr:MULTISPECIES: ArpU family phage packaging/lysis transcriptional regulator [Lacticaseibacillus]
MALVPDVDEQASRDNARKVLKEYRRYARMVGEPLVDIKSPSIDGMPRTQSFENSVEAKLTDRFNADLEYAAMRNALASMPFQFYWVLYYSFCTPAPMTAEEIAARVGLANKDAVDYVKRQALMWFAEAFKHGQCLKFRF